ncbi:lipopolysaccharide biosynthesis protein [Microbacterium sp. NPDC056234]|uniref:lipopolysaccharide biosynthesis protein n=1 Tax=Microbacterium sp. NPDC056234 TaxID=3345757 RepID=UPI0035D56D90
MSRGQIAGRLSGFTISVIIVTLVGVVSIPVLTDALGKTTWGILVVIQSVAQLGGIVVSFGWGATGAASVASMTVEERTGFYRSSLRIRAMLYLITLPFVFVILGILTRGMWLESLLGALVYLLPSVGAAWYFIGTGSPSRLIRFDTLPIVGGAVLGIVGAIVTGELWAYLAGQGLGYLVGVSLSALVILRGAPTGPSPVPWRDSLMAQRHAVLATLTSSLYVTLPVVAVQIFLPGAMPVYGLADRLFRYASVAFQPVQQFFQSWVPERGADVAARCRTATWAAAGIATLGGIAIAVLSPFVSLPLSSFQIQVPFALSIPLGVAFIGIGVAAVVGYACLVVLGRVSALAVSTLVGALVGAPLILLFAALGSLPLIAWSVAVSELCVAGYQLFVLRRALADRRIPA